MEKCVPIHRFTEDDSSALKMNLRLMHNFKIIHFDIKPDNILFSPHFQKAVFIDFGLSEVIVEPLGFKTLVQFRGSPAYCSEEMSHLLGEYSINDYVDAYHNDLHGLEKTLL
jgi:serine/threonine protein kinase